MEHFVWATLLNWNYNFTQLELQLYSTGAATLHNWSCNFTQLELQLDSTGAATLLNWSCSLTQLELQLYSTETSMFSNVVHKSILNLTEQDLNEAKAKNSSPSKHKP